MLSKHRYRTASQERRSSRTERFVTIMSSISGRQWVLSQHGRVWQPPTDVYDTDDSIVVKVEVAGMAEDDFRISFNEHTLVVAGIRHDPEAKLGYHQMEILYGEFRTDVYIPEAIEIDDIEASYKDGFLLVILPKARSRRVDIVHE